MAERLYQFYSHFVYHVSSGDSPWITSQSRPDLKKSTILTPKTDWYTDLRPSDGEIQRQRHSHFIRYCRHTNPPIYSIYFHEIFDISIFACISKLSHFYKETGGNYLLPFTLIKNTTDNTLTVCERASKRKSLHPSIESIVEWKISSDQCETFFLQ